MRLLPLGTIIKVNEIKVCIIGYTSAEKDAAAVCGYFVVPYPLGFININKVFFIPQNMNFEIIAEGYKTKASEQILDTISKSFEMVEKLPYEELMKFQEAYKKIVSSQKEVEDK